MADYSPDTPLISENHLKEQVYQALRRVAICLNLPVDKSSIHLGDLDLPQDQDDRFLLLKEVGRQAGIHFAEANLDAREIRSLINEGYPIVFWDADAQCWVLENLASRRFEAACISTDVNFPTLTLGKLRGLVAKNPTGQFFVAKKELECNSLSAASDQQNAHHDDHGDHHHPKPLNRFLSLLRLDTRDIGTLTIFAVVVGILSLATPLAIESLVNVVQWGTYLQPLLVLAAMLLTCLAIAGVLKILQTVIVELIQRRQLVRIVGDLAHRFPRAQRSALSGEYPRELANRVFDIMTIQKATSTLLLDGITLVLTTVMGLLLLAFYHPFLLGFDIVLLISMISLTWLLGRGGIITAIDESITKYRIAHWLQDVLASPTAFKIHGGEMLAIDRANRLASDYVKARQAQFRVLLRQITFAITLQVVASVVLLGLGGWLVIQQRLTLGQLVASELVVTTVLGAFAKAGKSLEKFYDLMAGTDKVGHLLDLPVDQRSDSGTLPEGPASVRWEDLQFHFPNTGSECEIPGAVVEPGMRVALTGDDRSGKSLLMKILSGMLRPHHGLAEIGGLDAQRAAFEPTGQMVGLAGQPEIFHATLRENVDLGRPNVGLGRVREVLQMAGLWDTVLKLPNGVQTVLQTDGYPLSRTQRMQLSLARAMAASPKLLLIDGLLDQFAPSVRDHVWKSVSSPNAPWTLLVVTNLPELIEQCDQSIELMSH